MDEFQVGDWVELQAYYHAFRLRKGTVGYVDGINGFKVEIRPTYHPDGQPVEINVRWIYKHDVKLLPVELGEQELDCLIDIALSEKDESAFIELVNRRKVIKE
ncbi:hypothetical protein [Peribacillus frigoritolerans]|uniref:hypothetical protein n=1 Tax=Peribacillus frigoritolerans TaxID=450367 RepID=UPI00216278BC|nr:hypothetical protein [Peribacillus frigoritolerans]